MVIFKTIGLPDVDQRHIEKSELSAELRSSSWCYRQYFEDGPPRLVCGAKQGDKQLFYESGGMDNYKLLAANEYFVGWDEPPWGFERYWMGKNIYFGYYPGASIVRKVVPIGAQLIIASGFLTALMICLYPVLILIAFSLNATSFFLKTIRKI